MNRRYGSAMAEVMISGRLCKFIGKRGRYYVYVHYRRKEVPAHPDASESTTVRWDGNTKADYIYLENQVE